MTLELSSRLSSQSHTAHMLLVRTEDENQGNQISKSECSTDLSRFVCLFLLLLLFLKFSFLLLFLKKKKETFGLDQLSHTSPAMPFAHSLPSKASPVNKHHALY